jgi:multidrug efflux system membrane fusion protein
VLAGGWLLSRASVSGVAVVHPSRGPAVQAVYATGTVEATVMLPIAARTAARLVELNVDEGSDVVKNQQLARLEDEDLQEGIAALRAKERFAKKDYERKAAIARGGYETKSGLDAARAAWDSARAALAQAEAEAGFMKLTAPEVGRIIRRDGEVGEMIAANQPVFWMSCCAPLRVSAEVDEEDIASVQPGQEVLIRADAFPGKTFSGKVQGITPKGDPVARSFRVRIGFAEDVPLRIGMTAEANIITGRRDNALLVPAAAVDGARVWIVEDGKLAPRTVEVGARGEEQVEITSGLAETDSVVLRPSPDMKAGDSVHAVPAP